MARKTPAPAASAPPIEIPGFDASALEALLDLSARQRHLEELRERAESRRDAVTPVVYQRVVADYQSRLAALRAEAAPLKGRVRAEYQKLREAADRLQERLGAAMLDKEELEFRRDLGEVAPADFEQQVEGPAGIIEQCQRELDGLAEHNERFLEALGPDEPSEAPEPEPQAELHAEPQPELQAEPQSAPIADVGTGSLPITEVDPFMESQAEPDSTITEEATVIVMSDAPATDLDATILGPPELSASALLAQGQARIPNGAQTQTDVQPPSFGFAPADSGEGETQALPQAMLVLEERGERTEFPLGVLSYIGRSEGNQVQLARAGVSRRHAMISLGADGHYIIKDLQSQNGTFLNGERVTDSRLNDGDRIAIGEAEVTFQLPAQ